MPHKRLPKRLPSVLVTALLFGQPHPVDDPPFREIDKKAASAKEGDRTARSFQDNLFHSILFLVLESPADGSVSVR